MDPIPSAGQHSEMILRELGFEESEISRLKEGGVI